MNSFYDPILTLDSMPVSTGIPKHVTILLLLSRAWIPKGIQA